MRYLIQTAAEAAREIEERMENGEAVYITDGTVTRRVETAELDSSGLFLRTEKNGWILLKVSQFFGRLDGWEIGTSAGEFLIAPAWFWI